MQSIGKCRQFLSVFKNHDYALPLQSSQLTVEGKYGLSRQHPRTFAPRYSLPHNVLTRQTRHAYSTAATSRGPLRIAVIGSGPAGFYTSYRIMNKLQDAAVDMYEQLPVPYGLVRYGVAPDHPEVKNCQDTFEQVAQSPRFAYIGNVRVGHDVQLSQMKPHYDAILFSYGATEDRRLCVPGEDLSGVYSAREFVGWYNGLPQFQGLDPDLLVGEKAIIIGQGNVALDVARILLTPVDQLRHTDITEQAIQTLSKSRIKSVRVVGRRGPLQAAFTVKELRELMHIENVKFTPIDRSFYPPDVKTLSRVPRRMTEVLIKGTTSQTQPTIKEWSLDFLKAPISINARASSISSVTFSEQRFLPDANSFHKAARVEATGVASAFETSLVFRSVGYKSTALPGLSDLGISFDSKLGIIPNDLYGRAIGKLTAGHISGLYCAGWVKRGPTGVIASTMDDAFTSADVIVSDWTANAPFLNHDSSAGNRHGWDAIKDEVTSKGVRSLSWDDWKKIDHMERERGERLGKPREKFASVQEMLAALDA